MKRTAQRLPVWNSCYVSTANLFLTFPSINSSATWQKIKLRWNLLRVRGFLLIPGYIKGVVKKTFMNIILYLICWKFNKEKRRTRPVYIFWAIKFVSKMLLYVRDISFPLSFLLLLFFFFTPPPTLPPFSHILLVYSIVFVSFVFFKQTKQPL